MFWGGSITRGITSKSTKLPQTKIRNIQKNNQVLERLIQDLQVINIHQIDTRLQIYKMYKRYKQFTP